MRKFNFDNLAIFSGEFDLLDQLWIDALKSPSLELPFYAPQPGPLFATFNGTAGDDILTGTSSDDILIGGAGNDIINGGDGLDIAVYTSSVEVDYRVLDLGNGDYYVRDLYSDEDGLDLLTGIEALRFGGINGTDFAITALASTADVTGTSGDDTLTATSGDIVSALAGNDIITGSNLSYAEIYAGAGEDTLNIDWAEDSLVSGGAGGDTFNITLAFDAIYLGGAGNDIFRVENSFGNIQEFTFDGGDGDDDVEFSFHSATSADLTGGAGIDTLRSSMDFEELDTINRFGGTIDITNNVTAGNYSELTLSGGFEVLVATGGGETDTLRGGSGNDVLEDGGFWAEDGPGSFYYGNGGNDFLYGMAGNDVIIGTGGQDILSGGDGDDVITSGGHYVQGYTDSSGGSFSETIISHATMIGGQGDDIFNSSGDDTFEGGEGDDTLINHSNAAVAIYSSVNTADYIIRETAISSEYTVQAIGGTGEGKDLLIGVDVIRLGGINGTDYDITTLALMASGGTDLTNGDDTYTSTDGEVVNGLDGNDTLTAGGFTSTLNGDGGDDILRDNFKDQTVLNGGTGADTIFLYAAQSVANGDDGNDEITIQYEASVANGGAGDDVIKATGAFSFNFFMTLDGGSGHDQLVFRYDVSSDSDNVNRFGGTLDMSTGMGSGDYSVTVSNFESLDFVGGGETDNITGTEGDDIINDGGFYTFFGGAGGFFPGNGNNDTINGGGGNDIIIGRGGIDTLSGGAGNDTITSGASQTFTYDDLGDTGTIERPAEALISGGDGNDTIISFGDDTIDGGAGDDVIIMGRSERDTATTTEGGAGIDEINFSNLDPAEGGGVANSLLVVDLQGQAYSLRNTGTNTVLFIDTFGVFENVTGSEYRDVLQGDGLDNVLRGLDGNDNLQGRAGDDILEGGMGLDSLSGGDGIDTAVYSSANVDDYDFVETATGEYTVTMLNGNTDGSDTLVGIEFVRLGGINGTDYDIATLANTGITLDGTSGNDTLNGTPGDDVLNGLGGADIFNGFAGNDIFIADFSDLEFNGGDGYDIIRFDFDVDGSGDSTFLIDFRDYDIDSIEEISLNPMLVGGGAGSATYFFEFGTSQFDQLIKFDALTEGDLQIFNDGVSSLDLTDFDSPVYNGSFAVYGGGTSGETFILTIDQDPVEFIGFGNDDIIISLHDPNVRWSFSAFGDTNSTSIDTVDFSQMLTVDDGNGGTIGLMTFDLSNNLIIQSGFGLSSNSSAQIIDFDIFIGWDGDDVFITNGNDNSFIGSAGDNTAVYSSSNVLDYAVNEIAPGQYTIQAIGSTGEGIDTLTDVQTVRLGGINGTDYDIDYLVSISPIDLTNGDDVYVGTADDNIVNGLDGNDIISGEDGNDTLNGDAGNDILRGGNGNDILNGGDGDDTLLGESGSDMFDGGAGTDTVSYNNFGDEITIDMLTGTASDGALGDSFVSIENITGSAFRNILRGDSNDNVLTGGDVNDTLQGRNGNDTLIGGFGDDDLNGGRGEDILFGQEGDDILTGRQSTEVDDDYAVYISTDPADYIVTYLGGITYTVQDVGGTGEGTDTLVSIEFIRLGGLNGTDYDISMFPSGNGDIDLTNGDDDYTGTAAHETVNGLDGNDIIRGEGGDDILNGDAGDDTLIGGTGSDELNGGDGQDTASYVGASAGATIDLVLGTSSGSAAGDVFDSIENLTGSDFRDVLRASHEDSELFGGGGDDLLQGRNGNDILSGGSGDDDLYGGRGDDIFISSVGEDAFDGGDDSDTVSYAEELSGAIITLADASTSGTYSGSAAGDILFGIENLIGTNFQDTFIGNVSANRLTGGGGNDILRGGNGDDVLLGGDGNDDLDGGNDNDILEGGAGDDTLNGRNGTDIAVYLSSDVNDYIFTETSSGNFTIEAIGGTNEGTDTLTNIQTVRLGGLSGTDHAIETLINNSGTIVNLTNDADTYSGTSADEIINGLDGDDIIDGGEGNNTLNGDAGDDILISLSNDVINGGDGNDTVEMGGNVFALSSATDGGADIDTISFSTLAQLPSANLFLVLDLSSQAYSVRDGSTVLYVDQFSSFESATGSEFGDLLQGDAGANLLSGLGGDDNLQGRDGNDIIDGGAGADIFNGGVGTDTASYASALAGVTAILCDASLNTGDAAGDSYMDIENITGSDFDDVLGGDANANIIDGGAGFDIASYEASSAAIVFDGLGLVAASGDIAADTLLNIEAIRGTDFNDRFFGGNDASIYYGGEGADRLFGRNGDDALYGEGGNDIILAGRDNDLLDGGAGNDQLRGNEGDDMLFGGDGNDALAGGAGADAMDGGAGIDRVEYTYGTNAGVIASLGNSAINTGDAAGDTYVNIENLYGTTFVDTLYGDAGNNRIDGRSGDDALFGGDGNDYLIGGAGNDVMNGEGGNDLLLGQAGADIYQFDAAHGTDRIIVFIQGEDLIEFTEGVFDFSGLTITQDGAHVNIETSEGTIIINNSLVADFATDDFIFATPPSNEPLDDTFAQNEVDLMAMDFEALI